MNRRYQTSEISWKSYALLLGLAIAVVLVGLYSARFIKKYKIAKDANAIHAAQLTELQKQQQFLEHRLELLSNEQGIDAELRDKYHLVKDGEELIIVVPDDSLQDN